MTDHTVYIGIGSNLGNPAKQVNLAITRLAQLPQSQLHAQSALYLTAPVEADGDDYVNAVICLLTTLSPEKLLTELQSLENDFGRERTYRNAPRTLDLDILLYDNRQIKKNTLIIPHPRMTERAFVLIPLLQISPDIAIPEKGPATQYLADVSQQPITPFKI